MGKRGPKTWISGAALKPVRNRRVVEARDLEKLSFPRIAKRFKISHQRVQAIYKREKERQAEAEA